MLGLALTPKEMLKRVLMYGAIMLMLAVIFCVLYGIVYVRCYNIMNPDDMIAFRLYRLNGDIYLILFNKLYRLF